MKIGLALGGGSARGLAHFGVIDVLLENGVSIDCVAGTSMGAVVGAAYAAGKHEEFKELSLSMDIWKLMNFIEPSLPYKGFLDGKRISDIFEEKLGIDRIEQTNIPYCAVCCNFKTGESVNLRKGSISKALRASMSIPGLFKPVKFGERVLVDGGVVDPVPVTAVREMGADIVIAVDLNHYVLDRKDRGSKKVLASIEERLFPWNKGLPDIFSLMMDSLYTMEKTIADLKMEQDPPDILLQPKVGDISFLEFYRAEEAILMGRREAEARIGDILSKTRTDRG